VAQTFLSVINSVGRDLSWQGELPGRVLAYGSTHRPKINWTFVGRNILTIVSLINRITCFSQTAGDLEKQMNGLKTTPILLSFLALAIGLAGCVERKSGVQDGTSGSVPAVPTAGVDSDDTQGDVRLASATSDDKLIPLDDLPKTDAGWKKRLSAEAFEVTREKGTEPSDTNKYNKHYKDGIYRCVGCGQRLFDSATKYDSYSGWPAFWKPYNDEVILEESEFFTRRTEVLCKRCGAHLGHVFEDGPEDQTGLRYCINSVAMDFQAREDIAVKSAKKKAAE
jgi:peptide-methionine (R)-S-oxide reductase